MSGRSLGGASEDRKSTRLNSSHTEIYTLSLHDALPIFGGSLLDEHRDVVPRSYRHRALVDHDERPFPGGSLRRSEEHTSELQSHRDLHSFPTRRSSDLRWLPPR